MSAPVFQCCLLLNKWLQYGLFAAVARKHFRVTLGAAWECSVISFGGWLSQATGIYAYCILRTAVAMWLMRILHTAYCNLQCGF